MNTTMTIERLTETLKQALERFQSAQTAYYLLLQETEEHHLELILTSGYGSFADYLEKNKLTKPAYHANLKAGRARIAEVIPGRAAAEVMQSIGHQATTVISQHRSASPEAVQAFVAKVEESKAARDGALPKNLQRIAIATGLQAAPLKKEVQPDEMAVLRGKLEVSEAELRAARAEIARLQARVAELEQKVRAA
jgi:hypothetical protein